MPPALTAAQRSALQRALGGFDAASVLRGRDYYLGNRVHRTDALGGDPARGFVATVQGSSRYEVEWVWRPGDQSWDHECTCPVGHACKHAYAAAQALLRGSATPPVSTPPAAHSDKTVAPNPPAGAARPIATSANPKTPGSVRLPGAPPDEAELVRLLEHRHARPLEKAERRLVQELVELWKRARQNGAVREADLAAVGIGPEAGMVAYPGYGVAFSGAWDSGDAPANALLFWQYLAFFAEHRERALPPLFGPITDLSLVRGRIAARERRREVKRWTSLFAEELDPLGSAFFPAAGPGAPAVHGPNPPRSVVRAPHEIRLRLTRPKLTWEYREAADRPWQTAKGGLVREWFGALAGATAVFPPAAMALLQEVQLGRLRGTQWGTAEPQTLNVEEPRTLALIAWLLRQPALRHQLVDSHGQPFATTTDPLHWRGRPDPAHGGDIAIELVRADDSPAPANLLVVPGDPALALAPEDPRVFTLPPDFPGATHGGRVHVPREVFEQPAVVRRLRRLAVRFEDVALPEITIVELRPRFVCTLGPHQNFSGVEWVKVEHLGVSPDGAHVHRRRPSGEWADLAAAKKAAPTPRGPICEIDRTRADAAHRLFHELSFAPGLDPVRWLHAIAPRSFPEQFAGWMERARAQGVELLCTPELAGLARPADQVKHEFSVRAADDAEEGPGIDWFDVEVALRVEDATLTEEEIALLLKARGQFVRLPGKGWRRLELAADPAADARLAELGLGSGALEDGPARQRFHALQLADERIAGLLPDQHAARVRERAAQLQAITPPAVPAALAAELRPYQREGFHFLAHLSANGLGGVLADDMGLGKTVQALAWLLHLAAAGVATKPAARRAKAFRALVVCPKSVVPNWENEAKRFAPSLAIAPLAGRAVPRDVAIVVANYTQLRLTAAELGGETWDAVILDEGQNIKNPQSQTAKVARELCATHRVVLTGTPIENRTLDLWSLFAFAMPELLGTQAAFRRAYNDKEDPAAARARLARRVKHFLLRRTKAQVAADLPPRTEEDLFVELEGAQRRLYDAELKRARVLLRGVGDDGALARQRFNILQSLLRLRQICCDPRLVGFEGDGTDGAQPPPAKSTTVRRKSTAASPSITPAADRAQPNTPSTAAGSAKLEALFDTLEPLVEEGHRVLVFSQFVTALELIAAELRAREIGFLTLTGQTENRQELVEKFQAADGPPVFLLSLKAAGAGLNLTAASYVVLFDPWWNPAVEAQAIDRTHRIGQKHPVIAYRLLARGTIEEKIRQLQRAKADLARAIVQEENLATVLNLDDLRFILGEEVGS